MSKAVKLKLDTLYFVEAADERSPQSYTRPTIEIYSATSDVTIRATTKPDFTGTATQLPVVTSEAEAGEIYDTTSARAVRYVSVSCSDTDAVIYMTGFKVKEVPQYVLNTVTISGVDGGIIPGIEFGLKNSNMVDACLLRVSGRTNGVLQTVSVYSATGMSTDVAGTYALPGGSGKVALTTTSVTTYKATDPLVIATAGTGYAVDDEVTYTVGTSVLTAVVTSVDTNGEVLTIGMVSCDQFAADFAGTIAMVGGTGTGLTLTVTTEATTTYTVSGATIDTAGSGYASSGKSLVSAAGAVIAFTAADLATIEVLDAGVFKANVAGTVLPDARLTTTATLTATTTAIYE